MSCVSKVSIALTPDLNALPRHAIENGDELQRLWAEGIPSGPGQLGGMDTIKREARRRLYGDS
jgi:hypothetical protein